MVCTICKAKICTNHQWVQHMNTHKPTSPDIPDLNQVIYGRTGYENCSAYKNILHKNYSLIKDDHVGNQYKELFNFQINYKFKYEDLYSELVNIYKKEEQDTGATIVERLDKKQFTNGPYKHEHTSELVKAIH